MPENQAGGSGKMKRKLYEKDLHKFHFNANAS
jgi:hypothetical protein